MTATKTIITMPVQSSHEIGSKANKQLQKMRPLLMSLSNHNKFIPSKESPL